MESQNQVCRPDRSEQINELAAALAKAQEEMQTAGMNADNPFFKSKYADLAEIVRASRPALTKNGLSVVQRTLVVNDEKVLSTLLLHSSGQWIEGIMPINPAKTDIQSLGSYISYLRRYTYAPMVGVVVVDEDDDGEGEMKPYRPAQQYDKPQQKRYESASTRREQTLSQCITKDQLDDMEFELNEYPELAKSILSAYGVDSLDNLPKEAYRTIMTKLRENKAAMGTK
jgi:hypothetical protein